MKPLPICPHTASLAPPIPGCGGTGPLAHQNMLHTLPLRPAHTHSSSPLLLYVAKFYMPFTIPFSSPEPLGSLSFPPQSTHGTVLTLLPAVVLSVGDPVATLQWTSALQGEGPDHAQAHIGGIQCLAGIMGSKFTLTLINLDTLFGTPEALSLENSYCPSL